ncbi:hypothetical protein PHLGIDRAFT_426624 [Phlebiopsis gigantea 11061_1 CR5-6]|uniref:Uncharacterized protein n=1 Tax=Phlebiopsis gigantea (strain 11061_1 CR5-6) TaxID=745531 RepID=A0A0C3RYJ0_PHLG1|nr:hypothetical protein PHLGIDRAFT_426624 [Phlebiopsis gigantea 11061_1 CR5-6]
MCNAMTAVSEQKLDLVILICRALGILGPIADITFTAVGTFRQHRIARRHSVTISVASLLLYNGASYFIIYLAMNVTVLAINYSNLSAYGIVGLIAQTLSPILVSRFMLNLRCLSINDEHDGSSHDSSIIFQAGAHPRSVFTQLEGFVDHQAQESIEHGQEAYGTETSSHIDNETNLTASESV